VRAADAQRSVASYLVGFKMNLSKVLLLALVFTSPGVAGVSLSFTGHFRGTVVDVRESRIKDAKVTVDGEGRQRKLDSNASGEFEIDLTPGIYRITVEKAGFVKFELTNLEIKSNSQRESTFQLEVARNLCEPICCKEFVLSKAPPNKALQLTARWHVSQVDLFLQLKC
jgi:hypothetical protein